MVDARRVAGTGVPDLWLQESPHVINPVIVIALLRQAHPNLHEMGAMYLDCTPIRGYVELTTRVSVLTLMPSSFAFCTLPSLLQNSRMLRQRLGFQQQYCRYAAAARTVPAGSASVPTTTTTTAVLVPDAERGARARALFDKPIRLFIASAHHHVEHATLYGELAMEDILAQLCIQLADANHLVAGWVFRANDRIISDDDLGFSAFFVAKDTSLRETAWIDARRFGRSPFPVRLPFTLTWDTLVAVCGLPMPASVQVAVSGVPWRGAPLILRQADVVVIGSLPHHLWTMPLAALEKRVNGISCLVIHQKGPRPTDRVVAFQDSTCSGSSRHVFDFSGLRIHWANVRLAWQVETCQLEHTQRCILVAADMPPIPVAAGLGVAPTARDVNLWYFSRFAQLFGDRTWCDSGLAFGDFCVFFDGALDATSRRPWVIDLGEALDVVIAGHDGAGLELWPAPEGWAIRPALITGPIGQAAIQRAAGGLPTIVFQPLPSERRHASAPAEEIASASSDDDVAVVGAAPPTTTAGVPPHEANATTAAYLQSLIEDPPTTEEALASVEAEDEPFADPNPFLQSLIEEPPTLQEIVSQFQNDADGLDDSPHEAPAGMQLLQVSTQFIAVPACNTAAASSKKLPTDVEETRPQADQKPELRRLPTPCRSSSATVAHYADTPRSRARGCMSAETMSKAPPLEAPSDIPASSHSASRYKPTTLALCDLLPAVPPNGTLLRTHANLDEYLSWMEPFGLHAFQTDLSNIPQLHPSTVHALRDMPVWRGPEACPVDSVQLYVDGSFFACNSSAAWAVVALVHAQQSWHWAGFMSGPLYGPDHPLHVGHSVNSPHTAELVALVYALATAVKLANVHCCVYYDATAAAGIAEARFVSQHEKVLMYALYNLSYLARQEVLSLDFVHVPAHEGHAFNEAADAVAKAAAARCFWHEPQAASFAAAIRQRGLDWAWWTTGPQVPSKVLPGLADSGLSLPDSQLLPRMHPLTHVPGIPTPVAAAHARPTAPVTWNLKLATYNCTTLTKECDRQCLATCFAKDGLDLVGLQETRTDPGPRYTQNSYSCFCAASDHGNLGCQLWVRTTAVVATGPCGDTRFEVNKCTVVVREPRLLVVVLPAGSQLFACVVAHAPLPETHPDATCQWWHRLDEVMRRLPRNALPLLFIDANARFSGQDTEGTARTKCPSNANAETFQPFLDEHRLDTCCSVTADGAPVVSWRSPHGNPAHLDFLAFPEELAPYSTTIGCPRSC